MVKFIYKAKRGLNESVEGFLEAESREDAINILVKRGLFPVSVDDESKSLPSKEPGQPQKKKNLAGLFKKNRLTSKDLLLFTRKLSTLIKAKVELLSAIRILYEQTEDAYIKDFLYQIFRSIKEGKSFSETLQALPAVFSPFYVNMVKAGETSGRLDLSLEQISEYLQRQEGLKSKVKLALAYPVLLLCVGCVSIFVLINFVVPKLRVVLESSAAQLPLITRAILFVSRLSEKTSFFLLPAIAAFIVLLAGYKGSYFLKLISAKLKKRLPVVKGIFANQELANFSWVLSLLIKSGTPIYQSFQIASKNIGDKELVSQLGVVCERLRNGDPLAKSMEASTNLPSFFIKMIGVGEESGRLPEILGEIAQSYTQEVESAIALVSSLLEPLLILLLGSVLGLIVFSIMLPIFEVTQVIK